MILSILIPSTYDRDKMTMTLVQEFVKQIEAYYTKTKGVHHFSSDSKEYESLCFNRYTLYKDDNFWLSDINAKIEILVSYDNKEVSVGSKRDVLYRRAKGKYSLQWDSDDWIAPNAIELIMEALKENPDCVTYQEAVTIDGVQYKSNHSIRYDDWEGDGHRLLDDGFHFHRTPFMKSVIRTDYCRHIGVADLRFGEDHDFARLIKPMLLKEVHFDQELYIYRHESSPHNERYGIKEA